MPSVAVHSDVVVKRIFMYVFKRASETGTSARLASECQPGAHLRAVQPNPSLTPQMKCRGPERLSDLLKGVQA